MAVPRSDALTMDGFDIKCCGEISFRLSVKRNQCVSRGSRIKEHLRMKTQTVYIHLKSHNINTLEGSPITWEILHSNIQSFNERRIIEALEIRKHSNNIMNGCIGRSLCI